MRKWLAVALVTFTCLVASIAVFWPITRSDRISMESYEMINNGMPRHEIEEVLGRPADYGPGQGPSMIGFGGTMASIRIEDEGELWRGSDCDILVCFNEDDTVTGKMCSTIRAEGFLDKVRRWLHL